MRRRQRSPEEPALRLKAPVRNRVTAAELQEVLLLPLQRLYKPVGSRSSLNILSSSMVGGGVSPT
jgi:hypothetical protein